jgi:signal transduction histidine kinase
MEKEVSCINARAIVDYVKKYNNGDISALVSGLHPEIDSLPDPVGFLRDPNNWVSCGVNAKLLERARLIFNDDMTAYNIGKFAAESMSLGYVQRIIVKALWSHRKVLKNIQKINDKWNRSKTVELLEVRSNHAIVRLHWERDMDLTKDFCLINKGVYTYLPLICGWDPMSVEETCCFFEGAPYCEYRLKWPIGNTFHALFSRFFTSKTVLMDTILEMEEDKKIIEQKYEEVNRLNLELNGKINQLLALQETGKAILSVLDLERLLTVIMNILSNVCRINRAIIMIINEEEACLQYIHGVGVDGELPETIKNYKIPLDRLSNILVRVIRRGRPEYIPEVESSTLNKDNLLLSFGRPTSVFALPLINRSRPIGVIATDGIDGKGVPKETRETLEVFGPQIAIAIENASLYSRLQEQMRKLETSHALLSRAERFSFLGGVAARLAHEIKNPMTAIGTFIQMLPQKLKDEEFLMEFHGIALEEANRINRLISELLDLVKKKESHFHLNNLHELIDRMVLLVSPQTKSKKIRVIRMFDANIDQVWMDSEKMKQVILNLLSNAVEFSPKGGEITILTRNHDRKVHPPLVQIEIKDNGMGIPADVIDKIFDPYFTTKHKSNIHNGTGLGLFIAYQNMQDHGGSIEVKSSNNGGTAFLLTLPVDPPDQT